MVGYRLRSFLEKVLIKLSYPKRFSDFYRTPKTFTLLPSSLETTANGISTSEIGIIISISEAAEAAL